MSMQEMEECPVGKKRATWETISDQKVCVSLSVSMSVCVRETGSAFMCLCSRNRLKQAGTLQATAKSTPSNP